MEKSIPYKSHKVPGLKVANVERELEVYEWLTQDEEDRKEQITLGDRAYEVEHGKEMTVTVSVTAEKMAELRRFKVEALCRNLTWEEFSIQPPKVRDAITEILEEAEKKK